eukprot:TRINITY_DN4982_c0_g1_i1.p1 TRINITY_DN4982_c0_g1~~TRINITY_DN4982_c0_g1_i1.p1  ORF type:complete len:749 (-),score=94.65 TRINITY_DN4982_c0_g1_i1:13-2259(-)
MNWRLLLLFFGLVLSLDTVAILKGLYEQTEGASWRPECRVGWGDDSPQDICRWYGIHCIKSKLDLKLDGCNLKGTIPETISEIPFSRFSVKNNSLIGPLPTFSNASLVIEIDRNLYSGRLNINLKHCTILKTFSAAFNRFDGILSIKIPSSLKSLNLYRNDISGMIADSSWSQSNIEVLDMSRNRMQQIPEGICEMTHLKQLIISSNHLTGEIPKCLTEMSSIHTLDLGRNELIGQIPVFLAVEFLVLSGNKLHEVDWDVFRSDSLTSADFSNNNLSGPISSSIIERSSINALWINFEGNYGMSGPIDPHITFIKYGKKQPDCSEFYIKGHQLDVTIRVSPTYFNDPSCQKIVNTSPLEFIFNMKTAATVFVLAITLILYFKKQREAYQTKRALKIFHDWLLHDPATVGMAKSDRRNLCNYLVNHHFFTIESLKKIKEESQLINLGGVLKERLFQAIQGLDHYLNDVVKESEIGKGAFGVVYKGVWRGNDVALKHPIGLGLSDFYQEIKMIATLGPHRNIVEYFGLVIIDKTLFLVTEYVPNGSLLSMLRSNIQRNTLIEMARDTIEGLRHLHAQKVVHRDLATRNLLVDAEHRIKVADFGLSHETMYGTISEDTLMPLRWTAPEALARKAFSCKSDIYSFGCVLYEMFTGGSHPWDTLETGEVRGAVCRQEKMPKPQSCPNDSYELMCKCWEFNPEARPSLENILNELMEMKNNPVDPTPSEIAIERADYDGTSNQQGLPDANISSE